MKIPTLLTVLALSCGAVFAQTSSGSHARDEAKNREQVAASPNSTAARVANSRPAVKTRNALNRAGNATGRVANRAGNATARVVNRVANGGRKVAKKVRGTEQTRRDDTRSMGAPAPASANRDSDRTRRMDDAYGNWQRRQN